MVPTSHPVLSFFSTQRHDFGSAACGALAVTTLAVARGQDPWTAASITAAATVTALVSFLGGWRRHFFSAAASQTALAPSSAGAHEPPSAPTQVVNDLMNDA